MINTLRFLALTGATLVVAEEMRNLAPFSDNIYTRTELPQELSSMTADGRLVYELNLCTVVESTSCQVSASTGNPVSKESTSSPINGPVESGKPGQGDPTPTEGNGQPPSAPGTTDPPTATKSEETDIPNTATESVAPEEPTGGAMKADVFDYGIVGIAGLAAAYFV